MIKPYKDAALDYFEAGWFPLPLAGPKGKTPLVNGRHGDNPYPTRAEVEEWREQYPDANIGLRLPPWVVGLDVDCYDDRVGAATLADAEARWGSLPAAWVSTARTDGSGIRLLRAPEGLAWPGQVGPNVDIIHSRNRFAVAAPSIRYKTGTRYRWVRPDGTTAVDEIPGAEDI